MELSPNITELLNKAIEAKIKGQYRSARAQLERALVEARRIKDYMGEANILFELGDIALLFDRDLTTAGKLWKECLKRYTRIRFERGRAHAMGGLGVLALYENKLDKASKWIGDALAIFDREQDKYGQAKTLHQLGALEERQGAIASAEEHLRRSLIIYEGIGNKYALGQVLITLGALYIDHIKDEEKASSVLNRAVTLFEEMGLPAEANKARHNLNVLASAKLSSETRL